MPLSLCLCLLQFNAQQSLICRGWDVLNSPNNCAFLVVMWLDVFGRASAYTWRFHPFVLCEHAHFGSRDLCLPQLSMQKVTPEGECEDAVPWDLKLLNAHKLLSTLRSCWMRSQRYPNPLPGKTCWKKPLLPTEPSHILSYLWDVWIPAVAAAVRVCKRPLRTVKSTAIKGLFPVWTTSISQIKTDVEEEGVREQHSANRCPPQSGDISATLANMIYRKPKSFCSVGQYVCHCRLEIPGMDRAQSNSSADGYF